jgi:thiamine transporter
MCAKTYAIDTFQPIATWLTIGILTTLVIVGVVIYALNFTMLKKYAKYATISFVVYAILIEITLLIMDLYKHYNSKYLDENWISSDVLVYVFMPIFITLGVIVLSLIANVIINKKKPEFIKTFYYIASTIIIISIVFTITMVALYYTNHIKNDGYYNSDTASVNQVALIIGTIVLFIALIAAVLVIDKKGNLIFDTKSIARAGICIATSFALSYVKIFKLPQGGSITLVSLLPIMLYAYMHGPKKGLAIGFIYGILQAIQDPFIIHPAQFLLDYPIAFAMVAFTGIFSNVKALEKLPQVKFVLGAICVAIFRYIAHLISGVFAFSAYCPENMNVFAYSAVYNSFVFVDMIFNMVLGAILLSSKAFVNALNPTFTNKKEVLAAEDED